MRISNFRISLLRAAAGLVFGLLLCFGLVAHLRVNQQDWLRLGQGLSWTWCLLVMILTMLLWWSGARKWAVWSLACHREAGAEPAHGFFFRHFAWQNWLGQFVPPSLAIILGRVWASRYMPGVSWRDGAANAVYDQALEFLLLAGLLPAAVLVLHDHAPLTLWLPVAALGMASVAATLWLFRKRFAEGMQMQLPLLLGWSAARVVLTVARLVVGAPALGLEIDLVHIAAAAPVVALLALVPLTPGNLGLAEWGWTGVLAFAGTAPVTAGLLALGFRILMFVVQSSLLAAYEGVFFLRKRR